MSHPKSFRTHTAPYFSPQLSQNLNLVALLVSVFLAILASVFSTKYYYVKGKASQLNALISKVTKAWEDKTLTQFSLEIDFVPKTVE